MLSENFNIKAGIESLSCSIDYGKSRKPPEIISLHGGGPSDKETTRYLGEYFSERDLSFARFDFSGQGESTGSMKGSSLSKRVNETKAVLDHFKVNYPITVIGTSMGGHVASLITAMFDVKNLILFCPAAYDRIALNVSFDEKFSEIIRTPDSYENSDVFEVLNKFKGNALTVIGNNDEIIPEQVIRRYIESLKNSELNLLLRLDDCPHRIHVWLEKNKKEQEKIFNAIEKLIR